MVLQVDDCANVLKVNFPEIDFLFMLDHSCGHDKHREDGLNAENMSKSFGGKESRLRDMTIKQETGYLGPHLHQVQVGDVQKMSFHEDDEGPFWMPLEQ